MSNKLKVTEEGNAVVVTFTDVAILDEVSIREIGDEIENLAKSKPKVNLVINFNAVDYLSSAVLGRLVKIFKAVKANEGKMLLCHVKNSILQVFKVTKLDKMFEIFPDQEKAVKSLKGAKSSSGFKFFWQK